MCCGVLILLLFFSFSLISHRSRTRKVCTALTFAHHRPSMFSLRDCHAYAHVVMCFRSSNFLPWVSFISCCARENEFCERKSYQQILRERYSNLFSHACCVFNAIVCDPSLLHNTVSAPRQRFLFCLAENVWGVCGPDRPERFILLHFGAPTNDVAVNLRFS